MKLSNALLGAILIGVSVTTTSCEIDEQDLPQPTSEQEGEVVIPFYCPACGMG